MRRPTSSQTGHLSSPGLPPLPRSGFVQSWARSFRNGGRHRAESACSGCAFRDARLGDRFRKLLTQIGSAMGQSIPLVCQDWANTKAAYRFFSNDRVSEADILAGHFQSTRDRAAATDGLVLVLHDTTEFNARSQKRSASPRA
nr:transposase DNA-binding-containing protein [Bradyrhizobium zhanjiangense]